MKVKQTLLRIFGLALTILGVALVGANSDHFWIGALGGVTFTLGLDIFVRQVIREEFRRHSLLG